MRSIPAAGGQRHVLAPSIALACLGLGSGTALGVAGQHTTLASFQAATRGNTLLEPFNGPDTNDLPSIAVSGGGYAYNVVAPVTSLGLIRSNGLGVGANAFADITRLVFSGRPVSAFAATFRATPVGSFTPISGQMTLVTDTGESFTINVAPSGTFFGITTSRPFTSVTINTAQAGSEFIDDVYVGVSATASELADQCADAPTVTPNSAAQYPFTTVNTGATATSIPGTCAFIPGLDNGLDVWLRFVSPVYGTVTITTCGANMDTVLRVFDSCGASGTGADAMQIVCNDDFCAATSPASGSTASQVQFRAHAGEDYLIRVSGYAGATGSGVLSFSVVPDCRADFNHTGGPQTVQDIFDFLNAWFGGC